MTAIHDLSSSLKAIFQTPFCSEWNVNRSLYLMSRPVQKISTFHAAVPKTWIFSNSDWKQKALLRGLTIQKFGSIHVEYKRYLIRLQAREKDKHNSQHGMIEISTEKNKILASSHCSGFVGVKAEKSSGEYEETLSRWAAAKKGMFSNTPTTTWIYSPHNVFFLNHPENLCLYELNSFFPCTLFFVLGFVFFLFLETTSGKLLCVAFTLQLFKSRRFWENGDPFYFRLKCPFYL